MNLHQDPVIRFTALLAVVLVALPAASAGGTDLDGEARGLRHHGVLQGEADLALFRIADEDTFQAPELRLDAASLYGYYFEVDWVTTNLLRTQLPSEESDVGSKAAPLQEAVLRSTGALPVFDVRIIPTSETTLQSSVRGISHLSVLPKAEMHRADGIVGQQGDRDDTLTGPEYQHFLFKQVDRPTVLSESKGGAMEVLVSGDFILEVFGVDVALEEGGTTTLYPTGVRQTTGPQDGPARVEREQLLRLFVENGTLSVRHADDDRLAQWAVFFTSLRGDEGVVAFQDLRGRWDLPDAALLGPDRFHFAEGYTGSLAPREDSRMDVALEEAQGPLAPTASLWLPPTGFNPVPIAVALLLVALGAVAARRLRRAPPLAHMESALEAGAFSRAARLAGRILRSEPNKESAHLGRAIALSRSGRPERVVRDLKPFLEHNDPSDGTLHYVLGLAYRDLGKEAAASEALSEAVRRTPALAQQVPDAPPGAPRRRVSEGDAQGYT